MPEARDGALGHPQGSGNLGLALACLKAAKGVLSYCGVELRHFSFPQGMATSVRIASLFIAQVGTCGQLTVRDISHEIATKRAVQEHKTTRWALWPEHAHLARAR